VSPELFALQFHSDGQWCWTCDSSGWVIPFDEDTLKLAGELPEETRRVPWAAVPNQLKRLGHCGNRRERRKERSARRREAWRAERKRGTV